MTRQTAAFFDLDRTLLDVNSAALWAKHELLSGNISTLQFGRALLWNLLYHLSLADVEQALNRAVQHYRGRLYDELQEETRRWFDSVVAQRLRPRAELALRAHKQQSHPLVLLTSASSFEASVAASTWELDAWLANDFPTDPDGRLLGTLETPLCYGPGKVTHATRWAEANGVDLRQSYFYSDSYSDLPMLEAVGHPRVISPDPRLKRIALKRGWPILDW